MTEFRDLVYKLSQIGVSYKFSKTIQKMYNYTQNCVLYEDELSNWFESNQGLKQGCILSPLLFSLYINDLSELIGGGVSLGDMCINALLYADDIVLIAERPRQLQLMINRLSVYCSERQLTVNMSKSQIMIMKRGGGVRRSDEFWTYNNIPIEITNSYKYLGVLITPSLNLNAYFKEKTSQCKAKIFSIWQDLIENPYINFQAKVELFNSVCRSTICYSGQVFGYRAHEEIDKIQRFFIKRVLKIPSSSPNYLMTTECGLAPMNLFCLKLHTNYIFKILFNPLSTEQHFFLDFYD